MKAIPAGSFKMGCVSGKACKENELPVHKVTLNGFSMMETEATFALWDVCVSDGGGKHKAKDANQFGRGNRPVINVSYNHITNSFIPWLNNKLNKRFKLPSEAQWEYAARSGTTTRYNFGETIDCSKALYGYYKPTRCFKITQPVKSFSPNGFGLYDMHGNAGERLQDCWHESYEGAPINGSTWLSNDCRYRVLRGGSWSSEPDGLHSASSRRYYNSQVNHADGFRLVLSN